MPSVFAVCHGQVVVIALTASAWSALAAWAGVLLAGLVGSVAYSQLKEARRLRLEQAQPYVVVLAEESAVGSWVVDLVIKNLGTTAATDVRVDIQPEPRRAASDDEVVTLPDSIPVLVPGQEWRTLWDTGVARGESGLPDRHQAQVRFRDSQGTHGYGYSFALDWGPLRAREAVTVYGEHHAAEALRKIEKLMNGWKEGAGHGLAIVARDGDARDKRQREVMEERRAQRAAKEPAPDAEQ